MSPFEVQENFALSTVFCDKTIHGLENLRNMNTDDTRLVFFRKCSQINDTSTMSYDFYQRYLLSSTSSYWNERFPNHIVSKKNKEKLANGYDQYIRTNYLLESYSAFESSIRLIVQAYDREKYQKLRYSFEKTYTWFMDELNRQNGIPIFQVFTNIRNSMHSNGLFCPFNQENEVIQYEQKTFIFEVGKRILYGGWMDIFSILKIMMMEFSIMTMNEKIEKIEFIKEPFGDS